MSGAQNSSITLSALEGDPLTDDRVREMVVATAHAIAERIGIKVVEVSATDSGITATLTCGRIEAWGFAAELRRLTNAWYAQKHGGVSLWGDPPERDDDEKQMWQDT